MPIKLSAYWWCQIIGWGLFLLLGSFYYVFVPGFTGFSSFYEIIIVTTLGLFSSHLMRFFIIKIKLLSKKIWQQLILLFLVIIMFSLINAIFQLTVFIIIDSNYSVSLKDLLRSLLYVGFLCANFLTFWGLIYFSYHYIQKSRRHLIEATRLESELKIQQLENENARLQFQKNIADVSFTALRSQMNPHFIFNCLNSIKLYTAQNNNAAASEYLTKFSRLIRLIMENLAKEKILLSSELDALRLYVEMEAMRFKEKLQYNIAVEKNVEPDYVELPPLLLQPYVENAIWHGLMHKEEGGKIDINVAMVNDDSLLQITIDDNGVGRAKSAELKNKKAATHRSYGMQVTSERIALINHIYKTGAEVQVEDLFDTRGNAAGTKVIIQIPV